MRADAVWDLTAPRPSRRPGSAPTTCGLTRPTRSAWRRSAKASWEPGFYALPICRQEFVCEEAGRTPTPSEAAAGVRNVIVSLRCHDVPGEGQAPAAGSLVWTMGLTLALATLLSLQLLADDDLSGKRLNVTAPSLRRTHLVMADRVRGGRRSCRTQPSFFDPSRVWQRKWLFPPDASISFCGPGKGSKL